MPNRKVLTTDGFTLLEVLVSLAILAIVLTAVIRLHAQSIAMSNAARFHTTAPLLLQAKLAAVRTAPFDELASDSGDFGDDFPGYTWQLRVEDVEASLLEATADRLKKLHIAVAFDRAAYRYEMEVYHFYQ